PAPRGAGGWGDRGGMEPRGGGRAGAASARSARVGACYILRPANHSFRSGEGPTIGDKWSYALDVEGRLVELTEGESTVGRSRGCTITLRDPSASRTHLLLTVKPGELWARDLQSSNGTYL